MHFRWGKSMCLYGRVFDELPSVSWKLSGWYLESGCLGIEDIGELEIVLTILSGDSPYLRRQPGEPHPPYEKRNVEVKSGEGCVDALYDEGSDGERENDERG